MTINYGIIAYTLENRENPRLSVLHFCGYESPPTDLDMFTLKEELNTDPEFGLVGKIDKGVFLMVAPLEVVDHFKKIIL